MKALIAYYSRRGENLVDGSVKPLRVGNTEWLVAILRRLTGADCFQIQQLEPYSENYYRCMDQARQDLLRNERPQLKNLPDSIEPYEVIYLGYPNYWGTMPAAVFTFLEQFDFTGKVIKPFCTHEGSGMGRSERDLRRVCPTAVIAPGLPVRGTDVQYRLAAVENWICESVNNTKHRKEV